MKDRVNHSGPEFWQHRAFWLALVLGPVCWLIMFELGVPLRQGPMPWLSVFMIGLLYPFVEEFIFRGVIQPALLSKRALAGTFHGLSTANVVTSVMFAALHGINQPAIWASLIFFPSLVFGWMRDRFNNIHASVVLHMFYNIGFALLFLNVSG